MARRGHLRNTLAQSLGLRNERSRRHDYLDLHRPVVDEDAVHNLESLAGTIGMMESDVGNASADATRSVRQLNLLHLTDGLLEVNLLRG